MADPRDPKKRWDEFYQGKWISLRDGILSRLDQLEKQVEIELKRTKGERGEKGKDGTDGKTGPDGEKGPDGYPPPVSYTCKFSPQGATASASVVSIAHTAVELKMGLAALSATGIGVDIAGVKDVKSTMNTEVNGELKGVGAVWNGTDLYASKRDINENDVSSVDNENNSLKSE